MCTVDTNLQILQAEYGCEQTRCGAGYSLPKLQFPFVMVSEARTIPRVAQHDRSEFFRPNCYSAALYRGAALAAARITPAKNNVSAK